VVSISFFPANCEFTASFWMDWLREPEVGSDARVKLLLKGRVAICEHFFGFGFEKHWPCEISLSESCVWCVLAFRTVKGNSSAKDFKYMNKTLEF